MEGVCFQIGFADERLLAAGGSLPQLDVGNFELRCAKKKRRCFESFLSREIRSTSS